MWLESCFAVNKRAYKTSDPSRCFQSCCLGWVYVGSRPERFTAVSQSDKPTNPFRSNDIPAVFNIISCMNQLQGLRIMAAFGNTRDRERLKQNGFATERDP